MARVARTALARSDLKDIGRYLAEQSQSRDVALRFLDAISKRCDLYASNAALGEACPDLSADVRRFSVGSYVVYYRPIRGGIAVLRVLHGSRDLPTAWQSRQ